jgi:predicted house-cleaning noncanonical NTP pyrophosphatase (MazG superfamily)
VRDLLLAKLQEEISEVDEALTAPHEQLDTAAVVEELSAVMEVLYSIAATLGVEPDQVDQARVASSRTMAASPAESSGWATPKMLPTRVSADARAHPRQQEYLSRTNAPAWPHTADAARSAAYRGDPQAPRPGRRPSRQHRRPDRTAQALRTDQRGRPARTVLPTRLQTE